MTHERTLACLIGGALGDAIGAAWEGREPGVDFELHDSLFLTDDTQFTMATCAAISKNDNVSPEAIAREFVNWFRARRFTRMGSSTLKAITELDAGGHWASVGSNGERAAGNGAAMRIAPLAFCIDPFQRSSRTLIRDISNITHRHDEAYLGALALLLTIRHAAENGQPTADFFRRLSTELPDSRLRDRIGEIIEPQVTIAEYAKKYGSSGYVIDSVPLAILASVKTNDFIDTMKTISKCGGDTDTIGSMFGQIYGAANGMDSLPMELLDRISDIQQAIDCFKKFASYSSA